MHIDSVNNKPLEKTHTNIHQRLSQSSILCRIFIFLSKKRHTHNVLQMLLILELSSNEVSKARNMSTLVSL